MRAWTLPTLAALLALTGCATYVGQADPRTTATAVTSIAPSRLGPATITGCGPGATATVTVTNRETWTVRYLVTVAFADQTGEPNAAGTLDTTGLAPGETRTGTATAPEALAGTITACTIERVEPLVANP